MEQIIIRERDFQKARKAIKEARASKKKIIFASDDDELNRKILEKENVDTLLLNMSEKKDRMKQRESGFNQVLARLAKGSGVSIGINLDEILSSRSKKEKSDILARIRQNVKLANKSKLKMEFISEKEYTKDRRDLRALGLVLGMPTWMTKEF
ncbi:MAG: hypothetical protein KKB29_03780 [Nanoarchaeota archaeon]|nr:hypothetical protein [Nanoarchaeota archaeon]